MSEPIVQGFRRFAAELQVAIEQPVAFSARQLIRLQIGQTDFFFTLDGEYDGRGRIIPEVRTL